MDKRSERTLIKIRESFEKLLLESKDYGITVKEITAEAGINRKTFYIHFECIEDLYRDLEERIEKELIDILESENFFDKNFSLKEFLNALLELVHTNPPLYDKLLTDDNYKFVFRKLKDKIKEKIVSSFLKENDRVETDLKIEFVFAGLMKVFRVWRAEWKEASVEKVYEITYSIVKRGISDIEIV